jgi:hypothetical protein
MIERAGCATSTTDVPQRIARQNNMPKFGAADLPTIWWWEESKAANLGGRQG